MRYYRAIEFSIRTLKGHIMFVQSVSFSPDGKYIASGSGDKTIKLWDVSDGSLIRTLKGHTGWVYSVSFSPDGKYLASGSHDNTIKLWRVSDGSLIRTLEGHAGYVQSVSFSPDGKYLASGSVHKTIKLWDVSDGHLIRTLEGHTGYVWSVSFSPDGKYLASGSGDNTIKLWRVSDGHLIMALEGHTGYVFSVSFSPDGKYLASGSRDETIKLWDVSDGSLIRTLKWHNLFVNSVSFSPDGKYLASGSQDKTIKLWRVSNGSLIRTLVGDTSGMHSVLFSPDGKYLASGSLDSTIKLWRVSDGSLIRTLEGHILFVYSVSFSSDGKYLASGSADETIKLWDVSDGSLIRTLKGHTDFVRSVSFSPDGKYLASGSNDKTIKLWDVEDGHLIMALEGHTSEVVSVSFSPDGKYLAFGSNDKTIKLWRVSDGHLIMALEGHTDIVWSVSFSPDGKYLASGSNDKTIKLWRVSDGHLIRTLEGYTGYVLSVSFSPDGKYLASGSEDKTIKLWDVLDGSLIRTFKGHTDSVNSVSFSPDGKYIASGSGDNTIKLWPKFNIEPENVYKLFKGLCEIESYSELNQIEKINPSDIPAEHWEIFIGRLEKEKKFEALKAFLSKIPTKKWPIIAYKLWFESCLRTKTLNEAVKSPSEIKKRDDWEKILGIYYELGLEMEKEGDTEAACAIYEKFVNEYVVYKDIPSRYQKLIVNSRDDTRGLREYPSYKETIISTAKNIEGAKLLKGKYELIREIGRGGMAIVYEAMNNEESKSVAIKKMREELAINLRERERFLEEGKRVAELHHPNIVDIYDMFEEGKNIYLVFEYINGKTVEWILSENRSFSLEEAKVIILGVCSALEYAHNRQIIHRDIKPSNIMVSGASMQRLDLVKVMDFGIAREAKDTLSRLTRQETSGTMAYMSPEQELGSFDIRSDIYSLGITLYEMLTGELPFKGPNFLAQKREMVYRPVTELLPEIPKKIDETISRCLQADKEKRYNSVEELVKELKS